MGYLKNFARLTAPVCITVMATLSLSGCGPKLAKPDYDPLEPMNRRVFWFNDQLDVHAIEPAAKAWNYVVPDDVQQALERVVTNSAFPVRLVNSLLQGKLQSSGIVVSRFVINTVAGVGGLFDPAATMGLERQEEDTGQTLGRWGIPAGPYLVIPLLGPSTVRDAVGLAADGFMSVWPYFSPFYVDFTVGTVTFINLRSLALDDIQEAKAVSLDYYTFIRNAYIQRRNAQLHDGAVLSEEQQKDLYEYDLDPEYGLEPFEE